MSSTTVGKKKTALVLGASGYLGQHISLAFMEKNWEVIGWGTRHINDEILSARGAFTYGTGDINDPDIQEEMVSGNPDAIVFCVSLTQTLSEKDVSAALQINVASLWQILKLASLRLRKPVPFIYLSTVQVYGDLVGFVDEQYRVEPRNAYGLTHLMAEMAINMFKTSEIIYPTVLRLSNGYGPPVTFQSSCWSLVVNDFCRTAFETKRIQIMSDGAALRDFVFVTDVSRAIAEIAMRKERKKLLNLASGKSISLLDIALMVQGEYYRKFGERIPITNSKGDEFKLLPESQNRPKFVFDIRERKESNIKIETQLGEGIQETFRYLERQVK